VGTGREENGQKTSNSMEAVEKGGTANNDPVIQEIFERWLGMVVAGIGRGSF
jgi:hypothetical protein